MSNAYGAAIVTEQPRQGDPLEHQVATATNAEAALQPSDHTEGNAPTHETIAVRAYERYLSRGGEDGADLDDWLEAERSLRSTPID